ncbi:hypothetical protein SESBI_19906 [Sesbania bispinosa]|nr:hypothetical protein SESBI_19906 [Sesbania bispinosa]
MEAKGGGLTVNTGGCDEEGDPCGWKAHREQRGWGGRSVWVEHDGEGGEGAGKKAVRARLV